MGSTGRGLLLELGVPFRQVDGQLLTESQAYNGLRHWCRHFKGVTVCAPVLPADFEIPSSVVWVSPQALIDSGDLTLVALPWAYSLLAYLRQRGAVRRLFARLIPEHRYLCFSSHGAYGCWGNDAGALATQQGRRHAVWFDWVVHRVAWSPNASWRHRVKALLLSPYVRWQTRRNIRHSDLGLFHGRTVYEAYRGWASNPQVVHNIHVSPAEAIDEATLAAKLAQQADPQRPLRIGYVGRVHPMKGPQAWIQAICGAAERLGPGRIRATWLGDGPLLDSCREQVREAGREEVISFPGFVADRSLLLGFLRQMDLLVFCHLTPESPRCLPEAMISGTALVGFDSAYAQDLAGELGGVRTVALGDVAALSDAIVALALDRPTLSRLCAEAALARQTFTDEAVFAHRSALIQQHT